MNPLAVVNGTLTYRADVKGYIFRSFEPLEVQATEPWVEKVVVACPAERPIEVTVTFASAPSADTARISGRLICRTILGRLALKYGLLVQEPITAAEYLEEEKDGWVTKVAAAGIPLACSGKDSKPVDPGEVACLKAELEDLSPRGEVYHDLYRVAMQAEDSVDRYMSLYRLSQSCAWTRTIKRGKSSWIVSSLRIPAKSRRTSVRTSCISWKLFTAACATRSATPGKAWTWRRPEDRLMRASTNWPRS